MTLNLRVYLHYLLIFFLLYSTFLMRETPMNYPIPFVKMSGTGNDFIIIDNRSDIVEPEEMRSLAVHACRRRQSVGADGLILLQGDADLDFSWRFFNSDGSEAEMCGNGARCAARFAQMEGITGSAMTFRTLAGPIRAEVDDDVVKVQLTAPAGAEDKFGLQLENGDEVEVGFIDNGVPHTVVVLQAGELADVDVAKMGREIRFHPRFAPAGTNVNFVEIIDDGGISVRTYERGVECETLACGTGAVASAIICAMLGLADPPVNVQTQGGDILRIYLDDEDPAGREVFLQGTALLVYRGQLTEETIRGG